jgi:lysyl-tRNA synthetase class 1
MPLIIPIAVQEFLQSLDQKREPLVPYVIAGRLSEIRQTLTEQSRDEESGAWAELAAFQFAAGRGDPWGTYFGPLCSGTRMDGTEMCFPDVHQADGEIVGYWKTRASEAAHPVLKARYADVVWDLSEVAGKVRRDSSFARVAIDSYIDTVNARLFQAPAEAAEYLTRAMDLSLSLNDSARVERVRDLMLVFYEKHGVASHPGTWGFLFDDLLQNKKIPLSADQRDQVVDTLEGILRVCSTLDSGDFDPFSAQSVAERLANYYQKAGRPDDKVRVIRAYGRAFEQISENASSLLAMSWLEPVIDAYRNLGLDEDVKRVLLLYSDKGKVANREMKTISVPVELTQEEIEAYLSAIVEGSLEECLMRIAERFTPSVQETRNLIRNIAKEHPLLGRIGVSRIADGQAVGSAGSIIDDEDGRVVFQLAERIGNFVGLLGLALEKARERHAMTADMVVDVLYKSPLFAEGRRKLIEAGFRAYFDGDFVKMIHVLVPQIEECIRKLMSLLGEPVNKPKGQNKGLLQQKTLNELLAEPAFVAKAGEDIRMYLLTLLADARGLNLRNRVCHGLLEAGECSQPVADCVFQVFMVLAKFRGETMPKA